MSGFRLTESELQLAFDAIEHHGYGIYWPVPKEWRVVGDHWQEFRGYLAKLDLDVYQAKPVLRPYAPKSRINVRPVDLLHPFDLVIYTALTLLIRDDVEAARVSPRKGRVYSYRSSGCPPGRLFMATAPAYTKLKEKLRSKASRTASRVVAVTDIADFYPRINQHRLENVIKAISRSQRSTDVARVLGRKLLGRLARGDSYGIPTGPWASTVLAEAVLIDVDSALLSKELDFVRWVDDFTFFCRTKTQAEHALFFLAEWLWEHHGLTLQPSKTKTLPSASYLRGLAKNYEARLRRRSKKLFKIWSRMSRDYGEFEVELDASDVAELEALNLKELLEEALGKSTKVDFEFASFILGKLASSPSMPTDKKQELVDVVMTNLAKLYPIISSVARFFLSLDDLPPRSRQAVARKVARHIWKARMRIPGFACMWLLVALSDGKGWNQSDVVRRLYSSTQSKAVRRYACLALSEKGGRSDILPTRGDLERASPLERTAILLAWRKAGKDERAHWKRMAVIDDPLEMKL